MDCSKCGCPSLGYMKPYEAKAGPVYVCPECGHHNAFELVELPGAPTLALRRIREGYGA